MSVDIAMNLFFLFASGLIGFMGLMGIVSFGKAFPFTLGVILTILSVLGLRHFRNGLRKAEDEYIHGKK